MLRSLSGIAGYRIEAIDGDAGRVQDFVFNDFLWTVRHAVAASGSFRYRKRIAIRCSALGQPRWASQVLPAGLTLAQLQQRTWELELEPASRRRDFAFSEDNWYRPSRFQVRWRWPCERRRRSQIANQTLPIRSSVVSRKSSATRFAAGRAASDESMISSWTTNIGRFVTSPFPLAIGCLVRRCWLSRSGSNRSQRTSAIW